MRSRLCYLLLLFLAVPVALARQAAPAPAAEEPVMSNPVPPTPAEVRMAGFAQKKALEARSLVTNVPLRPIGPTVMSGRVVDVDVSPADPTHFYVAYASGGLWKTTNNGASFEPLFDDQHTMTQGDVAVDWAHGETIWVGTGENNSSRSSYAGSGVYKSTDGGATWHHLGLAGSHRIGRIVLHPADPDVAWVAALGPLYSPGGERGIYKTEDGGATWRQTLFVNEDAGAVDLVIDPADPAVLYAATWERARRAWNFAEGGAGSGLYKSNDGGATWTRLSGGESGFPEGDGVGRIGLAVYAGDPSILYAILDNQNRRPEDVDDDAPVLTRDALRTMTNEAFLDVSEEDLDAFLRDHDFPETYTPASIRTMVEQGEITPLALVDYLEDANLMLFDTPVIGPEVYRSDDGGATWQRTHEDVIDALYYSYGYYFGQVRVAPDDPDKIYIMGVPILRSDDGGQTFLSINEPNVHVDHHALWVSPTRPGHLINGNDGGLNISWDDGATWFKANTPAVGQFYTVQVDRAEPYRVYGGLQDNGVWVGPHTYEASTRWHAEGDYPYDRLLGGDGMQVAVDARTNDVVYTGFQFGNYFRLDRATGAQTAIRPRHALGERPLRFNWQTPIHLSAHNQDILYLGSNKLHRSLQRGEDWQTISGDLTSGGQAGDVPYGTLTSIDESPHQFGLLYVGSDDGLVHVSHDGGASWTNISAGLPPDLWVSRVVASAHRQGRVYVTLNGYRWDHFDAYVYASEDDGQTWQRLGEDLPPEPVNVLAEDPANQDLLYVGTDHGLYVSLDRGASFMAMGGGLPYAPVHDLVVQPDAHDLVVGTHGRSLFVADIAPLQQLTPEMQARPVFAFDVEPVRHREDWGEQRASWREPSVPEVTLTYFAGAAGPATLTIRSADGTLLQTLTDDAEHGLNFAAYDLSVGPDRVEAFNKSRRKEEAEAPLLEPADDGAVYLVPGTYTVEVTLAGETATTTLEVKPPPAAEERAGPRESEEIK